MEYEIYELKPLRTNQKSFYGKANVVKAYNGNDVCYTLRSYDTVVVSLFVAADGAPFVKKLWNGYSVTTLRHVNELLTQLNFPKLSARVWRAMEIGEFYSPDELPALEKALK